MSRPSAPAPELWSPDSPWLLAHKVELPAPMEGYVRRRDVESRCALMDRRLTVLHAPGGFGKTALLAHCCRVPRKQGHAVAWLSFDEQDGAESVATYLVLAFRRACLEAFDLAGEQGSDAAAMVSVPDSHAEYWINLLIRALARRRRPCVLALDEVDRLQSSGAVSVINALLRRAPHNLHIGMAFREPPPGLEIAMFALEGQARTLTTEDLRFSPPDISRFFDGRLSRRDLAAVVADSGGWPLALRILRNVAHRGAVDVASDDDTLAGWIETRLWRGLSAEDRDFILDIALFDRLEPDLIDEATGTQNAGRRIASVRALSGLISATDGRKSTMRLHPLIKVYCEKRRFEEAPDRFRAIHRGIAQALERRARTVEALRHAREAGDEALLGRIAESTGGVRLWLEQGLQALRTLDELLTEAVLWKHPRLVLVRCVALAVAGDIDSARRVYRAADAETAGFTRDREGGDDRALQIDHVFVHGMLHTIGCSLYGDWTTRTAEAAEAAANAADTDSLLRGMFSLGMCLTNTQMAAFDNAAEWAGRARTLLGRTSPHLAHVDFQAGMVAMARGRTHEARRRYDQALKIARASHLRDAGAVVVGEILKAELALERSAGGIQRPDDTRVSSRLLGRCGAWLDVYAASIGVRAELEMLDGDFRSAIALVEDSHEYARRTERPALVRYLSALRVAVLLASDEVDEAVRAWRCHSLPGRVAECLDLGSQSWREMEMLASARLRLFVACGEIDEARDFAAALQAAAASRDLVRTRMRGLALSMVVEHRAGAADRAAAHVVDYLRLFAEADYVWPLAREGTVALTVLDDAANAAEADPAIAAAAAGLSHALRGDTGAGKDRMDRPLSDREFDVLVRLEWQSDKEIAQALKLSYDGVRYHVRRIFAKLGARGRLDAVHRARARGILPQAEETPEVPLDTAIQDLGG